LPLDGFKVSGDNYAAGFTINEFAEHGIEYGPVLLKEQRQDKNKIYLELLPLLNTRRVILLDLPDLLREFRLLERRPGRTHDIVDHRRGAHDDRANAAAAACVLAVGAPASDPQAARDVIAATIAAPPVGADSHRAFYGSSSGGSLGGQAFGHSGSTDPFRDGIGTSVGQFR
jgi:hypothetical protein